MSHGERYTKNMNTQLEKVIGTDRSEEKPLVSVVMPVYNSEKYLKAALNSLLEQSYKNIEIICVNDGSTDHSLAILERMAASDRRIKIINQSNGGPAKARNAALDAAKGKYVSFVDSDDFVDKEMYSTLVEVAEKQKTDILVFGGSPWPDWDSAPQWIKDKLSPRAITYDGEHAGEDAIFKERSSTPFLWIHFLKREILEKPTKIRLREDIDLGEDQIFQFDYFPRAKKVVYIDRRFYFYRWNNEGSLMWKYNHMQTEKFRKHLKIIETVFDDWQKIGYDDIHGYLASWMVSFLYYDLKNFPKYLQIEFAKKIKAITSKYDIQLYMCNEYEFEHGKEIEELADSNESDEEIVFEEIVSLKYEIQQVEDEIQARLKSKAFKLGKLLTRKSKRLNIETVLPPQRKKN